MRNDSVEIPMEQVFFESEHGLIVEGWVPWQCAGHLFGRVLGALS